MKKLIYILGLSIYSLSCTWDKSPLDCDPLIPCDPVITLSPNPPDTCFDYNMEFYDLPQIYYPIGFGSPYYSPLSMYEFIYTMSSSNNSDPSDSKTVNVNICDGNKFFITPFPYGDIHQFKWSKKDWLMFGYPGLIYLMKSNGDSLHLLNDIVGENSLLYSATWIGQGDKIFCTNYHTMSFIISSTGEILDTIPFLCGESAELNGKLATTSLTGAGKIIGYLDLNTSVFHNIISYPFSGSAAVSIDWLNEDEIIWVDLTHGIYKLSVNNGDITTIKQGCNSLVYSDLSVSPANNGDFLVQRNKTWVANDTAYHKTETLKINAYTGEEWIVNLEQ